MDLRWPCKPLSRPLATFYGVALDLRVPVAREAGRGGRRDSPPPSSVLATPARQGRFASAPPTTPCDASETGGDVATVPMTYRAARRTRAMRPTSGTSTSG